MRGGWVAAMARCFPPVAALRAVIVASVTVAAFAFPVSAQAFTLSKSTNGVILQRSAENTGSVRVYVYYDYKGSEAATAVWDASYDPFTVSSYERWYWSTGNSYMVMNASAQADTIEIPRPGAQYRFWFINIVTNEYAPVAIDRFALVNEPLDVTISNSPTVSVSDLPPISLSSSVSVAGTMPVEVAGIGPFDSSALQVLGVAFMLVVGAAFHYVAGGYRV